MKRVKVYYAVLSLLVGSSISGYSYAIAPTDQVLPEIVSTATRTNDANKLTPVLSTTIKQKDFDKLGATHVEKSFSNIAGVNVVKENGGVGLSIHGMDPSYTIYLIDGVRIPMEPQKMGELRRIPLVNIKQIDIVKEPSSALYGSDAMSGVVNFITKRSNKEEKEVTLYKSFSNNKSFEGNLFISLGNSKKIGYTLSFDNTNRLSNLRSNGSTYYPYGDLRNIDLSVDYKINNNSKIRLAGHNFHESTTEMASMPRGYLTKYNTNKRNIVSLEYIKDYDSRQLRALFGYSNWSIYSDFSPMKNVYTNTVWGKIVDKQLTLQMMDDSINKHRLLYGVDIRNENFVGTGVKTGEQNFVHYYHNKPYIGSGETTNNIGVFLQDEWSIGDKDLIINSFRYEKNTDYKGHMNYRMGWTHLMPNNVKFKFNAGNAYRVPAVNQRFLDLNIFINGAPVGIHGNNKLLPENATFFDTSLEKTLNKDKGIIKVTYFNTYMKNLIEQRWISRNIQSFFNVGKARSEGVEVSYSGEKGRINWNVNFTYTDAKNLVSHQALLNIPKRQLGFSLGYVVNDRLNMHFNINTYLNQEKLIPPSERKTYNYTLVDFNSEYKLNNQSIIKYGIYNIFNKKISDFDIPGITPYISYSYKF